MMCPLCGKNIEHLLLKEINFYETTVDDGSINVSPKPSQTMDDGFYCPKCRKRVAKTNSQVIELWVKSK